MVPGSARPATLTGTAGVGTSLGDYATFLATGVAAYTDGPNAVVGWAMGELLGTQGGDVPAALSSQLTALSGQLDEITSQLNTIEGQLSQITNEIQDSTYLQAIKSLTTDHVAPLLSMWQQYCDIVSSKDTNAATLKQLTGDVLSSSTGVRAHITAIAQTFKGSTLTGDVPLPGMFSQFVLNQKEAPTFDDRVVYQNYLTPYTTYFASLAVMGMTLMVEAFHAQGDAVGAQAALKDLWADTGTIYRAGGYPLTDDTVITDNLTGKVWTRNGACFTAQFDSTDAKQWTSSSDPAQSALAFNAIEAGPGGTKPPGTSYVFSKGDSVCSTFWATLGPDPSSFLPTMIKESILPSATLYTGTGNPGSVWTDPVQSDLQTLTSARGTSSSQTYLNANGFSIPSKGVGGVTTLAYAFWQHFTSGQPGVFDTTTDAYTCTFRATCGGGGWVGLLLMATPQCWLGSSDYQGIPTTCGTAWVATEWPAAPPPPATTTTAGSSTVSPSASGPTG